MRDVISTAEKSYEQRTGKKVRVAKKEGAKEIKKVIARESTTRKIKTWADFILSLQC